MHVVSIVEGEARSAPGQGGHTAETLLGEEDMGAACVVAPDGSLTEHGDPEALAAPRNGGVLNGDEHGAGRVLAVGTMALAGVGERVALVNRSGPEGRSPRRSLRRPDLRGRSPRDPLRGVDRGCDPSEGRG